MDLSSFEAFRTHPWTVDLLEEYRKDATLALAALDRIHTDLEEINDVYEDRYGRVVFTAISGRVKTEDSFFRKLYGACVEQAPSHGLSPQTLKRFYSSISDICGIRFACPYLDEVKHAVHKIVRPELGEVRGYATDLRREPRYRDKDYLDEGDKFGYRSYHFYVKVPAFMDIYGTVEMCLCEVQARSELQQVWADKSHNLLYKPESGWRIDDPSIIEEMKQVSNSLRAADTFLMSIRDRVRTVAERSKQS
ncbi:MAG: hypothetical protein U0768_17385 [Anaerolineae bacterium]